MPDNQPIFTKEKIHDIFCSMSQEQKIGFAFQCSLYNIEPAKLEETLFAIMQGLERSMDSVVENYLYWCFDKGDE